MRRTLLASAVLALTTCSAVAAAQTVLDDPLAGSTSGTQNGGQFVSDGWQAPGQVSWDVGIPITEGGMSVEVTNWNPDATSPQHHFDKQHIINMYEGAHGSPHGADGDSPKTSFFNVRTGAGYDNFFKFLSSTSGFDAPPEGRDETRLARDPGFINPANTYEIKVTWTLGGSMTAYLDNAELVTHQHTKPFKLRYVFIGTDNAPAGTYGPQSDVIYKNVKVWGTSTVPDAGTGGTGGSAGAGGSGGSTGGTSTFDVIADTWSEPGAPDATHGSDQDLRTGGDGRTIYLRFEVTGVGQVTNARIIMEAMNGGGGGDIHTVSDNTWSEDTLTHNNRPSPASQVLSSLGTVDIGSEYSFDVTAAVPGNGVYSFAITSTDTDGSGYLSKESSGPHPQLVITWEPGGTGGSGGGGGSSGTGGAAGWSAFDGGTGGSAGTGTGGSSADAGHDASPGGSSASGGGEDGDDGCGCATPGRRGNGGAAWLGVIAAVWLVRRRRQPAA